MKILNPADWRNIVQNQLATLNDLKLPHLPTKIAESISILARNGPVWNRQATKSTPTPASRIRLRQQGMSRRIVITAEVIGGMFPRSIIVRGQTARTLLALVEAGPNGCTALEVSSWAYRFSAYCHDLIHKHGLVIRTDKERHPGGWHGRYVLETPVRILEWN